MNNIESSALALVAALAAELESVRGERDKAERGRVNALAERDEAERRLMDAQYHLDDHAVDNAVDNARAEGIMIGETAFRARLAGIVTVNAVVEAACAVHASKIEAIKTVKILTGLGLRESKDLVENRLAEVRYRAENG